MAKTGFTQGLPINEIVCGDALELMTQWPAESIDCCVTSPPYWGLRDYGVDGQMGLEKTPEEYVAKMVEIFREVWRVLKDEGTLWLNMGDTYYMRSVRGGEKPGMNNFNGLLKSNKGAFIRPKVKGLKPKDMCGMPWMLAFALRADGWYLRQDIIWHKPNPMPESVRDRCTKAHEYIFLLSKQPKYYCDMEAIREPVKENSGQNMRAPKNGDERMTDGYKNVTSKTYNEIKGANKRSVWTVTTKPYSEAHFATFPPDLILPCILAGCPKDGVVLDPFMGSGTTAMVAYENRRKYVGCELNPEYIKLNRAELARQKYGLYE